MPRMVSEISQGQAFDYSVEENKPSLSATRVFRILKTHPAETINIAAACGITNGSPHPTVPGTFCYHYSGAYEGDSRMVILATFNYRLLTAANKEDPNERPPEIRPANWHTSTSLVEVPAYQWEEVLTVSGRGIGPKTATENPVGDLYDGVTKLEPIVTISIDQFESDDPTRHNMHAGKTNNKQMTVGSMIIPLRCLMFRGVTAKPTVENWGEAVYRGWMCTYEFLFKRNTATACYEDPINSNIYKEKEADIGWDILQPVSGFNVKTFMPNAPFADEDPYGMPLKWDGLGAVVMPLALPAGTAPASKVRAHVKIGIRDGFTGQRPSASPVPLNPKRGTPRLESADPKVVVLRYKVTEEMDFDTFGLRLY